MIAGHHLCPSVCCFIPGWLSTTSETSQVWKGWSSPVHTSWQNALALAVRKWAKKSSRRINHLLIWILQVGTDLGPSSDFSPARARHCLSPKKTFPACPFLWMKSLCFWGKPQFFSHQVQFVRASGQCSNPSDLSIDSHRIFW